jgi:hypothetical protein
MQREHESKEKMARGRKEGNRLSLLRIKLPWILIFEFTFVA